MDKVKSRMVLFFFIAGAFLFAACNQNNTKVVHNEEKNPDNVAGQVPGSSPATTEMGVEQMLEGETVVFEDAVSPVFKNRFKLVVNSYLAMKDGFVHDDEKEIDKEVAQMTALLHSIPDNLLSGTARNYWNEKKSFVLEHLQLYKASEKVEEKRKNFVFLSTVMTKSVKAF